MYCAWMVKALMGWYEFQYNQFFRRKEYVCLHMLEYAIQEKLSFLKIKKNIIMLFTKHVTH